MGMPARQMRTDAPRRKAASRPRTSAARKPRTARASVGAAPFMVAIVLVAAIGVARVAVTTQAAEAALDSGEILAEIKAERLESDRLEIDKSALSTPSRLEGIAGEAMSMAVPREVTYIEAGSVGEAAGGAAPVAAAADGGFGDALLALARAAAAEARVLLVGDVGLSAAR